MKAALTLAILLAACSKPASHPANKTESDQPMALPAAKPSEPTAKPFVFDEENDLIDFHFGWSAEAAAVPQLVATFKAAMDKDKAELLANAKADKAGRERQGFPFNSYMSSTEYETAGQSGRLLSLRGNFGAYTGGAHGNSGTKGLLWDRAAAKELKFADLFAAAANMDRLLTQPWCDALNKAREEKRGEPIGGGGMFDECPKLDEISTIPADKDGNGKFERLLLVADPYVAGPYVEGSYEIELPITGDLVAAIRSDFREHLEVQPQ
jgi:hypothetical protein